MRWCCVAESALAESPGLQDAAWIDGPGQLVLVCLKFQCKAMAEASAQGCWAVGLKAGFVLHLCKCKSAVGFSCKIAGKAVVAADVLHDFS